MAKCSFKVYYQLYTNVLEKSYTIILFLFFVDFYSHREYIFSYFSVFFEILTLFYIVFFLKINLEVQNQLFFKILRKSGIFYSHVAFLLKMLVKHRVNYFTVFHFIRNSDIYLLTLYVPSYRWRNSITTNFTVFSEILTYFSYMVYSYFSYMMSFSYTHG